MQKVVKYLGYTITLPDQFSLGMYTIKGPDLHGGCWSLEEAKEWIRRERKMLRRKAGDGHIRS